MKTNIVLLCSIIDCGKRFEFLIRSSAACRFCAADSEPFAITQVLCPLVSRVTGLRVRRRRHLSRLHMFLRRCAQCAGGVAAASAAALALPEPSDKGFDAMVERRKASLGAATVYDVDMPAQYKRLAQRQDKQFMWQTLFDSRRINRVAIFRWAAAAAPEESGALGLV